MRFRLILGLILLVAVPVTALGVLAMRLMADEQAGLQRQVAQVLMGDLKRSAAGIDTLVKQRWEAVADQLPIATDSAETLRRRLDETPWISAFFIQRADGRLRYPDPKGSLSTSERAFLARSQQLWTRAGQFAKPAEGGSEAPRQGWYPWLHENGLHLMAWARLDDGTLVGAELDRMRFLSDLIADLPSSDERTDERRVLRDARGEVVYQWGGFEPPKGTKALASAPLAEPLRGWRLDILLSHSAFAGRMGPGIRVALFSGVAALGLMLILVAVFLYRSTERDRREAQQRVTFVNQVSHELKTPLTNIRMYAELLEGRLEDEQARAKRDLSVIVSESQRLSRLINNVLGFARQGRGPQRLKGQRRSPNEVIEQVLRQFAPALERAGLSVSSDLTTETEMLIDADAIGQVLANLVSNVEKYGASGGVMRVTSRLDHRGVRVRVEDEGPGVAPPFRQHLFEPFRRAESALTEGVSGTGIGLALSRDIARLHGGDLELIQSDDGACFELSFTSLEEVS